MKFTCEREVILHEIANAYEIISVRNSLSILSNCSDDTKSFRRHPDGVEELLFVESPDRPFYLERDKEDLDLGRIVITFVPDAGPSSVAAVN